LTIEKDYVADFWEFLPAGKENDFFGNLAKKIQSQLATQLTIGNDCKAGLWDILPAGKEEDFFGSRQKFSKVSLLLNWLIK